jgi:hypothetical protein
MESGLICPGAVSEHRMPETAVLEAVNFNFDTIGAATLRKGTTALGTGLDGSNVLGLFYHVDTVTPNTHTQLIAVTGTVAYYLSAGTWTSKRTGLTTGSKARFCTFLNYCFMVNGTEATAIWDGNTSNSFVTTGNASGAPIGAFIENFKTRIWIAGNATFPSRVYFSSVPSAATTPVVSWSTDVATGQWIDVSPSDGDFMTGLQRYKTTLLAFKTNHLYRIFDIGQLDPDPWAYVGTSSQESILETKAGVFFHHSTGIYQYNVYGIVQEISRPVIDFIRAIPSSAYTSIAGWVDPLGDHLCWSIGTVTVNGTTYTNCVLRYTISTQVWTHYSYPTQIMVATRRQPLYNDNTSLYALAGDTAGNVLKMDTGITDNSTPISYSLIHRWDKIDGVLSTRKTVTTINFLHYGGASTQAAFQTDEDAPDDLNNWSHPVDGGEFQVKNTGFNSADIKGRKVRFRIFGQSSGQPFQYFGYELLSVTSEFIQFT